MKKIILFSLLVGFFTANVSANSASLRLEFIQKNLEFDKYKQVHLVSFEVLSSDLLRVSVERGNSGPITLLMKGPAYFWEHSNYPILFISSGFDAGAKSLNLIQEDLGAILVGMDYSTTKKDIERDPSLFLKMIRTTPGQIVAAIQWIQEQKWYNKKLGLHYMGISLGSLFMPVSLSLAQKNGIYVSSEIFGFGGTDIGQIFEHHLRPLLGNEWSLNIKNAVELITLFYEPRLYLQELKAPNLLIFAKKDQIFPYTSMEKLIQLTPDPKKIVWIDGQHIDVDRPEVISETIQIVAQWLQVQIHSTSL